MADLVFFNNVFFSFPFKCSGPYMLWLGPAARHTQRRRTATWQTRDKELGGFCSSVGEDRGLKQTWGVFEKSVKELKINVCSEPDALNHPAVLPPWCKMWRVFLLSAGLIQIYNIEGKYKTYVLVEYEAVIWRCFTNVSESVPSHFGSSSFPVLPSLASDITQVIKLYSQIHSINITIINETLGDPPVWDA